MLHRKSTYVLFLLTFLLFSLSTTATTYYLSSSSGSDYNSGTDPSSPWQSINKINSISLQPGDNVLFKRGDTFYGSLKISNSGSTGNPITFGAYGSGNKPILTGFTTVSSWRNVGGNIWESTNAISNLPTLNIVLVNGVNTPIGRYPNSGFFSFQSHSGASSITSSSLSGSTNWTGAKVVVRTNRWSFAKKTITSQSGGTLYYADGTAEPVMNNFGFFIEDDSRTLDAQGEWYYNPNTKKLDIYSTNQPNNVQITSVEKIISGIHQNNVTIDNLDIRGANTDAISLENSQYPTITNCDISYTGVFGIQVTNSSSYADIEHNNISDCGSSSIESMDFGPYYTIKYNNIKRSSLVSTILPDDYNGAAIHCPGNYSLIQYNQIDSSGYDGISFRGTNSQVRNNFINYSCLVRDDGGGIYTGYAGEPGKVIDGNIILNSQGNSLGTATEVHCSGIYIDDLGNNMTISNNTIANSSSAGLFVHNSNNITIKNNTLFNNGVPQSFVTGSLCLQASGPSMVKGLNISNNVFFAKNPDQLCWFYYSVADANDVKSFGSSDGNFFAKPIGDAQTFIIRPSSSNPGDQFNLSGWRSWSGKDGNSSSSSKTISNVSDLRFEYNPTSQSKTISLDASYVDAKGNSYDGSITLAPYSSAVLIKNGPATNNSLLPAVNPSNTVNGLDYKYYEASSFTYLPDFNSIKPVKTGTSSTFDISLANASTDYSFDFTGYINVPSDGQYTFYTSSDDGSALYIDDISVISNDGLHGLTEKSGSIGLKAGKHAIRVSYFQHGGDQTLAVNYSGPGVSKQVIPSSSLYRVSQSSSNLLPAVNPSNTVNGIDYKYYESSNFTYLPDFNSISPVKTGTSNTFDISLANTSSDYSFDFTGYISVPSDGQYTFYTSSDDGSDLYIDNVPVVNNDGLHSLTEKSGTIGLKAGKHAIRVTFFQHGGDQTLAVNYSGPSVSKQAIPSSSLYRVSASSSNLLPAVNPSNTVNGIDYKYYESSGFTYLPDFNSISPVKTGTSNTFDISLANRNNDYSFDFTGYINVPSDGQYTFYTSSDDGSDLYIDNVPLVNNDGLHSLTEKSGTIGLKAGKHAIRVTYFQHGYDNTLIVSYEGPGVSKQVIPSSSLYRVSQSSGSNLLPAVNPSNTVNGIDYKYYESSGFTYLPDFNSISPVKTGTSNTFDISLANRNNDYSFDFTGYINVPSDGQYTFYTSSDDGSDLYIDNVPVVNNDGLHSLTEKSGTIGLKAGKHAIRVTYFQHGYNNTLIVSYEGPGVSKQQIPSSSLYRNSLLSQSVMVNPSSAMMFSNDSTNFQMQRLLNGSQMTPGVKVYPNPFKNSIQIDINGQSASRFKLVLMTESGQSVWIKDISNYNQSYHEVVNTSALPIGIYFLKLIENNKVSSVTKLLKEY